jgi:hypothetical protein
MIGFFLAFKVAQACVVEAAGGRTAMKHFMESYKARLTARLQSVTATMDPDVLMLPGGSVIALVLWLVEHRPHAKPLH